MLDEGCFGEGGAKSPTDGAEGEGWSAKEEHVPSGSTGHQAKDLMEDGCDIPKEQGCIAQGRGQA